MAFKFNPFTGQFDIVNPEPDLSGYVPYTGASADVDLGVYDYKGAGFSAYSGTYSYDFLTTASGGLILGDPSGDTRGVNSIDISAFRSSSSKVASGLRSILIGSGEVLGTDSVCIGGGAAIGSGNVVIGSGTTGTGYGCFSLAGGTTGANGYDIAIGSAAATGGGSFAAGQSSVASGAGSYSIGTFSSATGEYSMSIGSIVVSSADRAVSVGYNITNTTPNSVAIGSGSKGYGSPNDISLLVETTQSSFTTPVLMKGAAGVELVRNGAFSGSLYWTMGSGWSNYISKLRATNVTSGVTTQFSGDMYTPVVAGALYTLTYTISSYITGSVRVTVGGVTLSTRSANGTYTENFTAVSSDTDLVFEGVTTPLSLRIDDVSLLKQPHTPLIVNALFDQITAKYDDSNYCKINVDSTGLTTIDAVGASAGFIFSDYVQATFKSSDGTAGFTGTGAYTNFTIKDGLVVNAS